MDRIVQISSAFLRSTATAVLGNVLGVVRPGEVLPDVGAEEFKGFHPPYLCFTNVKCAVLVFLPPRANNHFLSVLIV